MNERQLLSGSRLAGYRIERPIGRGGMGEVYLARDERLGRPVALKVLPERFAEDERFRERLLRESRLAASLDHPNVVPIYEAGEADGRLFIAMRFVDGHRPEGAAAPRGARWRPSAAARDHRRQLADALDAAHRRGLVHRDVKPSNVLLDQQDGREHSYLADFGLTQSAADRGPADGQLMGTVDYVAPEQIRGDAVDGRADQYALGCLMFEWLTGTLPFRDGSEVAAIFAHLEEPPPVGERAPAGAAARRSTRSSRARWRRTPERALFELRASSSRRPRDALGLAAAGDASPRRARSARLVARGRGRRPARGRRRRAAVGRGGSAARGRADAAALVRLDPSDGPRARPDAGPGLPRRRRGDARRDLDGRLPARASSGATSRAPGAWSRSRRTASRATSPRSAARSTSRPTARWSPGVVARYDAQTAVGVRRTSTCSPARWHPATVSSGRRAVRSCSASAPAHGPLRMLHEVFLPFRAPATVSNSACSSARWRSAPAR